MKIQEFIRENPDVNITVKFGELMSFGQNIADQAIKGYIKKHEEKVYSRKEVVQTFGICEATLWRWDKMGLIESKKIGNRVFYPESEIKRLSTTKPRKNGDQ